MNGCCCASMPDSSAWPVTRTTCAFTAPEPGVFLLQGTRTAKGMAASRLNLKANIAFLRHNFGCVAAGACADRQDRGIIFK